MPILYQSVALVETAEEAGLNELLAAGLNRYVVRQVAPTCVVVDHERLDDIRKLFKRLGQTPRIVSE